MNKINLIPILLATDDVSKLSKLRISNLGILSFEPNIKGLHYHGLEHTYQHLYLCSTLPIKEGDWFIDLSSKIVYQKFARSSEWKLDNNLVKIEFTTDQKLISDGVPKIDENTKVIIETIPSIFSADFKEGTFIELFIKAYNRIQINDEIGKLPAYESGLTAEESGIEGIKMEISCELYPRPITFSGNELGEEGKDWKWCVEPYDGEPKIYLKIE